jgi:hypothetical protein
MNYIMCQELRREKATWARWPTVNTLLDERQHHKMAIMRQRSVNILFH